MGYSLWGRKESDTIEVTEHKHILLMVVFCKSHCLRYLFQMPKQNIQVVKCKIKKLKRSNGSLLDHFHWESLFAENISINTKSSNH